MSHSPTARSALLILNPAAGHGRTARFETPLREAARKLGWEIEIHRTERPGHEVTLAANARAKWPVVVAVGGDGTAHGVANGLLIGGPTDTILAHVALGSGNDFARAIGMPRRSPERGLASALGGTVRRLDVGRALGEYFVNGFGVGLGAQVVRETLRLSRLRGLALYAAAAVRAFAAFRPPELTVESEEHSACGRFLMVEVGNGPTGGGGFRLTPDARPDDGLLDACVIREVGAWRFVRSLPSVVRGTHGRLAPVTLFKTRWILVGGVGDPVAVHLDGELRHPTARAIEVDIEPGALNVLCGPSLPS
jgi:YegS/Rv2252/BmrU family lipid kinase